MSAQEMQMSIQMHTFVWRVQKILHKVPMCLISLRMYERIRWPSIHATFSSLFSHCATIKMLHDVCTVYSTFAVLLLLKFKTG